MKDYILSVGNSTVGPVGFVARVTAKNMEDALALIKEAVSDLEEGCEVNDFTEGSAVSIRVYLNAEALKVSDIEEE